MLRIKNLALQLNSTSSQIVEVERHDQVGVIYLNSPSDLNALTAEMRSQFSKAIKELDDDNSIKVIVLLSKVEKAFCAGADIKEFQHTSLEKELTHWSFEGVVTPLTQLHKILISGVNGVALGGGLEIALFSDIILCSEEARLGLPELKLGLIPGIGGTQRLAKIIGRQNAMRYILSSDFITAPQAQIVKREALKDECLKLAKRIAEKSLYTLIAAKEAIRQAEEVGLAQGNRYERILYSALHNTQGPKEGVKAFLEKRQPDFRKI